MSGGKGAAGGHMGRNGRGGARSGFFDRELESTEPESPVLGEERLLAAILAQVIRDCQGSEPEEARAAFEWVRVGHPMLKVCCIAHDIDPYRFRNIVLKNYTLWRAKAPPPTVITKRRLDYELAMENAL